MRAMFQSMSEPAPIKPSRWVTDEVRGETGPDLVVDALSEALYVSEVEDLMLCDFQVRQDEEGLSLRLGGVPMAEAEATGAAIKAVTYHGLTVEEGPDGWYGRVFFDV